MFVPSERQRPFAPGTRPSEGRSPHPHGSHGARLAGGLKDLWGADGKAQRQCRLKRISPEVQLIEHSGPETRRLAYGGLATCKSCLCPLCAPKWQRTRSEEITQAIDNWGARRVLFGTLTARHNKSTPLALLHRILTRAYGHLWSGREGQQLAADFGGKPESVRAHDRTWSNEYGWHPHLHVLLFRRSEAQTIDELEELLATRWPRALGTALRSMKRFCRKTLGYASQWEMCKRAGFGGWCMGSRCTCEKCMRVRAKRIFGSKLIPNREPLLDALRRVAKLLDGMSETSLHPNRERGVKLELARPDDRAPQYLAKLGLEIAFNDAKHVHRRYDPRLKREIEHYPYWGVAHVATRHGHPLRAACRKAWSELFRATRATQAITFSSRKALGLGEDPYADGNEPPEASAEEFTRLLGTIAGGTWDALKKDQKHGLLVTLGDAHDLGVVGELPYVKRPTGNHGIPSSRGPPKERYRSPEGIHRAVALHHAEERGAAAVRAAFEAMPPPKGGWVPLKPIEHKPVFLDALIERRARCLQLGLRFEPW